MSFAVESSCFSAKSYRCNYWWRWKFRDTRNCDGCPHPSQLSVNHAIKQREFNVNSENRVTDKQFDLSSKSFGIKFTTSYFSLGVGIFWSFFAICCLLTQNHVLASHEFLMTTSRAQFVTRSVVGLHCPFILMSIKKPLGLLHSVLWHAMWCSVIISMCLFEKGQSSFCHFSLLVHSICYAASFCNSLLHIFCMLSSLEIPIVSWSLNSCICHWCICPFNFSWEPLHFSHLFGFVLLSIRSLATFSWAFHSVLQGAKRKRTTSHC